MTEKQEMDSRIEEIKWDDKSEFLEVMLVKDISDVKVIYREDDDGLEIENIIFEKIKKGV